MEGIKREYKAVTETLTMRGTSRGPRMTSVSGTRVGNAPEGRISGYVCNYNVPGKS